MRVHLRKSTSGELAERATRLMEHTDNLVRAGRIFEKGFRRALGELDLDNAHICAAGASNAYERAADESFIRASTWAKLYSSAAFSFSLTSDQQVEKVSLGDPILLLKRAENLSSQIRDRAAMARIQGKLKEAERELVDLYRHAY